VTYQTKAPAISCRWSHELQRLCGQIHTKFKNVGRERCGVVTRPQKACRAAWVHAQRSAMPADGDALLALCAEVAGADAAKKLSCSADAYFSRVGALRKTSKTGEGIFSAADAKKEGGTLVKLANVSLKQQVSRQRLVQCCVGPERTHAFACNTPATHTCTTHHTSMKAIHTRGYMV
jgi:hypothetical protein